MNKYFCIFLFFLSCIHARLGQCQVMIDGIVLNGTCKGVLKHGRFVGYYDNTMPAWEVHYKNGVLHGQFKHFYPDGSLHFAGFYKNAKLHGRFYQYNTKDKALKTQFKNGVLHNWLYVFDNNQKIEALKYYYGKLVGQKYFD